jgi:hypothetical protein
VKAGAYAAATAVAGSNAKLLLYMHVAIYTLSTRAVILLAIATIALVVQAMTIVAERLPSAATRIKAAVQPQHAQRPEHARHNQQQGQLYLQRQHLQWQ